MILKTLMILFLMCLTTQAESIYLFTNPKNCPHCVELENKVLNNKEVQSLMRKFDAVFKINITRHRNITKYYNIKSIPTLLIVRREERYTEKEGNILRNSTVKGVAVWPMPGTSLTNTNAFIRFLKINLEKQAKSQEQDDPDIIRKF